MKTPVHLQVHSYYSLLSATPSPEVLAQQATAEGMPALALTDTHTLHGAVAFQRACEGAGVKPIIGLTVAVLWPETVRPSPPHPIIAGQLVLLARNNAGYRSLCQISSLLHTAPDPKSALMLEQLRANAEGLVCLTGGRRGFAHRCFAPGTCAVGTPAGTGALVPDCSRAAHRWLGRLCGIFGPDRTFVSLEIQTPDDAVAARYLAEKAAFLGLRTVVVQPIYTLDPDDEARLRLLAAIDRNCPLGDVPPEALPHGGDRRVTTHWLNARQMAERYADYPEALARTASLAEDLTTEPCLPDGTLQWPSLALPGNLSPAETLRKRVQAGAESRYGKPLPGKVQNRLENELMAINAHGYAPLFLAVADIVRYARSQEIPVSTRGSVANSLVAYGMQITTVDPVEHGLLFERFLSPGRSDPPDIDLDFCSRRREQVQDYVRRTYGWDRVALVGAMSTLQPRSAARETAKAYGLTEAETKRLLVHMPRHHHPGQQHKPLAEVLGSIPEPWLQEIARAAHSIIGFPHHLSIHAGGLVITPGPLTDLVPVQMAPKGYLTTQYDHGDCEAIGLPKLDLLGIRALTVLADAADAIREEEPDFRLDAIPMDDEQTGAALAAGDTIGVFQCDSIGARRTLRKLRAGTVRDLAVANAFFKPGPATGGQADIFVRRYRGEALTTYQHPALEPILSSTQGVLIFQEQVLRVATEIAGLSWAQADHIRRGMSKMQSSEMRDLAEAFVAGCRRADGPGFTEAQALELWEQVSAFSGYGFNQGHATAYADVSYRSTYLRVHHPAAFFWARLRNYGGYHHPAVYMAEAARLGIEVRIPHINHSVANVRLMRLSSTTSTGLPKPRQDDAPTTLHPTDDMQTSVLWLGLGLVRDLRRQAVTSIIKARHKDGPFASLRDLLVRVDLQPKEITHLIQCGALDGLEPSTQHGDGSFDSLVARANRPAMLAEAQSVLTAGSARQLAFDFAAGYAPPASLSQHLHWERHLLGYPLDALQRIMSALVTRDRSHIPVAHLPETRGNVSVFGVRLPGWHRDGYAVWDGAGWCWAELPKGMKAPPTWHPARFQGQWRRDQWGMGRMMIERYDVLRGTVQRSR